MSHALVLAASRSSCDLHQALSYPAYISMHGRSVRCRTTITRGLYVRFDFPRNCIVAFANAAQT